MSHPYSSARTYTVKLTVTNNGSLLSSTSQSITVKVKPELPAVGYAYSYGIYYASYADQDTALIIMNSGGHDTYYTLKVYDAYGSLIDAVSGNLDPFESDYKVLSDIAGTTDTSWGLVLLKSPNILTVGVETFISDHWMSSDNVIDPIPETKDYSYYWYGRAPLELCQ